MSRKNRDLRLWLRLKLGLEDAKYSRVLPKSREDVGDTVTVLRAWAMRIVAEEDRSPGQEIGGKIIEPWQVDFLRQIDTLLPNNLDTKGARWAEIDRELEDEKQRAKDQRPPAPMEDQTPRPQLPPQAPMPPTTGQKRGRDEGGSSSSDALVQSSHPTHAAETPDQAVSSLSADDLIAMPVAELDVNFALNSMREAHAAPSEFTSVRTEAELEAARVTSENIEAGLLEIIKLAREMRHKLHADEQTAAHLLSAHAPAMAAIAAVAAEQQPSTRHASLPATAAEQESEDSSVVHRSLAAAYRSCSAPAPGSSEQQITEQQIVEAEQMAEKASTLLKQGHLGWAEAMITQALRMMRVTP